MSPLETLTAYLREIERRLRWQALARGLAWVAGVALVATVLLVLASNGLAFSAWSVTAARWLLYLILASAVGAGLVLPLVRTGRRDAARAAEQAFPHFEQRLITLAERSEAPSPFLELLASETLGAVGAAHPQRIARRGRVAVFSSLAAGAAGVLIWLAAAGPGFLGYGTALLWAGVPRGVDRPFYQIVVEPGNQTVRKNSDQRITARVLGMAPERVRLLARFQSASKWEETGMAPRADAPGYEFLLAGIPEALEYYVEASGVRSPTYRLNVVDLPSVKRIRVTYNFPAWTGLKSEVEDPGGDLRAVEGTEASLQIVTDRPLGQGLLELDSGTRVELHPDGANRYQAQVKVAKDDLYHIASVERGETVRLSEDYFIEARKDNPPEVRIVRPGRDAKANPVEEVAVTVEAHDDFGLAGVDLRYSVNGGEEKTVPLAGKGRKDGGGTATIYLEDFKLSPGDVVSLHATARDARNSAKTDIFFIEAQPFEREYSQSQVMGGGGGGGEGEDENRISQRQKEIIAATWNEMKGPNARAQAAENSRFLSEMQGKLEAQARSLAKRMRSRQLAAAADSFNAFVKEMEEAATAMGPAAKELKAGRWREAIGPEQQALQHLLRAEATYRRIQVAFGSSRGGGRGGGRGSMGRDLESLFDLELDTEKNQYESGQQSASGGDQREKEIDEALARLEQLARRQQELAERQRNNNTPNSQQRWQQEMLRREAEQLQRRMEQLSRSGGQQAGGQQSGQQSGGQQQAGGQQQSGQQRAGTQPRSAGQAQLDRALQRLSEATREMRGAAAPGANPQNQADARRAADRLKEARDLLSGMRRDQTTGQLDSLAERAGRLAGAQQEFSGRLRQQFGSALDRNSIPPPGQNTRESNQRLAEEQQALADQLEQLERELQNAVRGLSSTQKDAAAKTRQALGNLQQEEPGSRMRWSAEAIRRGMGAYAAVRTAPVTTALSALEQQLREAQKSLDRGQQGADGTGEALARVERLRRELERMAARGREQAQGGQRQPGQGGQQPGQQGQSGEGGQQGGQQGQNGQGGGQGGQQGQSGQGGQRGGERRQGGGAPGGGYPAINAGDWQPGQGGGETATGGYAGERTYREALRDLSQLRRALDDSPEAKRDVDDLIERMQKIDPRRFPGNPELLSRMSAELLPSLEQLEIRLRRKAEETEGAVRSGAADPVPPGFAGPVAEYFKRLSRGR